MNNPKPRDDDQRSSVANQKNQQSQKEGPAAYAPLPDEQSSADEARAPEAMLGLKSMFICTTSSLSDPTRLRLSRIRGRTGQRHIESAVDNPQTKEPPPKRALSFNYLVRVRLLVPVVVGSFIR
jgi:hypothetical protein